MGIPKDVPKEKIVLLAEGTSMGLSRSFAVDAAVYVDPERYYRLTYAEKPRVRDILHEVNWRLRGKGKHLLLLVPGRIGTSSPELGVPTAFSDISEFDHVVEIACSRAGYRPELSYGSHFFQDLVEARIGYIAAFENEKTKVFQPELLAKGRDVTTEFLPPEKERNAGAASCVSVYDLAGTGLVLYLDMAADTLLLSFSGEA